VPVSLANNINRLSPTLKKFLQKEMGAILSINNSKEANITIINNYYEQLFSYRSTKYVSNLKQWHGLPIVYRALTNFGRLSLDDEEAYHLAENFPSILLYNSEEFLLTWEFLFFLGRLKFFTEQNFLLAHLFALTKKELLSWASWLSPTLNEYNQKKLVKFIYTYCQSINEPVGQVICFKNKTLPQFFKANENWLLKEKVSFYRFFQKNSLSNSRAVCKKFKYGLLTYQQSDLKVRVPLEFQNKAIVS